MTLPKNFQELFYAGGATPKYENTIFTNGWMDSEEWLPDLLFIQVPGNCLLLSIPG